ncbi:MAG: bifunctional molybdenum cofactor biosynthesis protein MoaC/MoaB [Bacteroidota bacterium]
MIDITHKSSTLRTAKVVAVVRFGNPATAAAIRENLVPKGNVLEAARTAGLFGIKRTSDLIPDCHPLPLEHAAFEFSLEEQSLSIHLEVRTIYKTGVEVEAMTGASIAALTCYDMLKPIDSGVFIGEVRLLEKKGGKSSFKQELLESIAASVIVCSDTVSSGSKTDAAGKEVVSRLTGMSVNVVHYSVIPDEVDAIQKHLRDEVAAGRQLVIFVGGTGLSPRDVTPEAIRPMLERPIPGIEEFIRDYGQQRMPYAMLSRSVAGMIGETLVLALPGSTRGAIESMDAVFPSLFHVFRVRKAFRHEEDGK